MSSEEENNIYESNFDNNYENNFGLIFNNFDTIFNDENFNNGAQNLRDILYNSNLFDIGDNFDMSFLNMIVSSNVNSVLSSMFEDNFGRHDEQYESVIEESFEDQPTLKKTDNIINISSQKFKALSKKLKSDNKECSICLNDFEKNDDVSITTCKHIFHNTCITEWGKYKMSDEETKTECPICRTKIE